jgi:hypothetical protein
MTKRAFLRVTLQQVPFAGGSDDPNRWRLYGKRGTAPGANGAGMTLQAEGPYTTTQHTQGVMLTTSGTAPPTSSNFPGATPAKLVSARAMPSNAGQPIVEIRGDGGGRWGNLQVTNSGVATLTEDWITLTLLNSWAPASGQPGGLTQPLQIRREGNKVHLRGAISGGTSQVIANIPTGYRPTVQNGHVLVYDQTNGTGRLVTVRVDNGNIQGPGGSPEIRFGGYYFID